MLCQDIGFGKLHVHTSASRTSAVWNYTVTLNAQELSTLGEQSTTVPTQPQQEVCRRMSAVVLSITAEIGHCLGDR
jgi:hypothetical protein